MTSLLPFSWLPKAPLLLLGDRRKRKRERDTEPTDTERTETDATEPIADTTLVLLVIAVTMCQQTRSLGNVLAVHENVLLVPKIAATCKMLHKYLMHNQTWLGQLQSLMYRQNMQLSGAFCTLIHNAMLKKLRENRGETKDIAYKIVRTFMTSKWSIYSSLRLYDTFTDRLNGMLGFLQNGPHWFVDEAGDAISLQYLIPIWSKSCTVFSCASIWPEIPQDAYTLAALELWQCEVDESNSTLLFRLNTEMFLHEEDENGFVSPENFTATLTLSWSVLKGSVGNTKPYWVYADTCCEGEWDTSQQDFDDNSWNMDATTSFLPEYPAQRQYDLPWTTKCVDVNLDIGDKLVCVVGLLGEDGNRNGIPFARLLFEIETEQEEVDIAYVCRSEQEFQQASLLQWLRTMTTRLRAEQESPFVET